MKRNRNADLGKSADLLSRRVYVLTREAVRAEAGVKELRDLCGLLKDTVAAAGALEKQAEEGAGTLFVTFDAGIADYAE